MSIDWAVGNNNNLLITTQGDIRTVTEVDHVIQSLKLRLTSFWDEWFLDGATGVRYFEDILGYPNPSYAEVDASIKSVIAGTEGVFELITYEGSYDRTTRKYNIKFEVYTTYGTLTLEVINGIWGY